MLLVWPRTGGDWGGRLSAARGCIAQAARLLARDQRVILVTPDAEAQTSLADYLGKDDLDKIQVRQLPADDIWARDFGPLTVHIGSQRHFLDYRFDGWRKRYPATHDDRITAALAQSGAFGAGHYRRRPHVLEGGAVESDGAGTIMATRSSLLEHPRNPGDQQRIWDLRFREELGAERVLWLNHGHLAGDDTDGHIDTLVRFVPGGALVYQACDDPQDPHYESLAALADQLAGLKRADGQRYHLLPLPLPRPQKDADGRRLPAGYANFLIGNKTVLVPQYADAADAEASRVLESCFPDREVAGIDCRPLIRQNGAIHCAAMQISALQSDPN